MSDRFQDDSDTISGQQSLLLHSSVLVLNRDLFFGVKIGNTLRQLGYGIELVSSTNDLLQRIDDASSPFSLVIIDSTAGVEWEAIASFVRESGGSPPVLAFGPHKDVDGLRSARNAGVTRVVSNGEFHRKMVELVERYAHTGITVTSPSTGKQPTKEITIDRRSQA